MFRHSLIMHDRKKYELRVRYANINVFIVFHCHRNVLTYWGRVTHICVSKLTIIGSDHGLSPGPCQAIIWTNAGILLIRTLGTNFSEILGKFHSFSFKKMRLKISSAKGRLFSLELNELECVNIYATPKFTALIELARFSKILDISVKLQVLFVWISLCAFVYYGHIQWKTYWISRNLYYKCWH